MTEHTSSISSVDAAFDALKAAGIASGTIEQGIKQLVQQRDALLGENVGMRQIIDSVTDLDNEPQYHEGGMGCGIEDRGITDRYEACRHGWDEAMERVYGEVIPCAHELDFSNTDRLLAERDADTIHKFLSEVTTKIFPENEASRALSFLRLSIDYISQLRNGEAE